MNKHNAVYWLRVSYWAGAIVDGIAAIAILFPKLTQFFLGFPGEAVDPQTERGLLAFSSSSLDRLQANKWDDRESSPPGCHLRQLDS